MEQPQEKALLLPRKCDATNRIIGPKDHASIQLAFAELNSDGRMTGAKKVFNISGDVRRRGESDSSINQLACQRGITAPFLLKLDAPNRTA